MSQFLKIDDADVQRVTRVAWGLVFILKVKHDAASQLATDPAALMGGMLGLSQDPSVSAPMPVLL